ncbi:MAG: hypothetical protein L0H70_01180 [Xanthomonadales bacterium]|nr:hypothetical protein [Xanthomonadales bacterium]
MKMHIVSLAATAVAGLLLAVTATAATPQPAMPMAATPATATATTAAPAQNWYGGPVYDGAPALGVTAALVKAGGGAANFSFPTALVNMLGQKTVNAEVAKLNKQYGEKKVQDFLNGMTYAVNTGLKEATKAGVKLPAPADLSGSKLAAALVTAGTASDGTFWSGLLFDKALSHDLHNKVMMDININKSAVQDQTVHQVLNQAMYDVAQALGMKQVKLAKLH